MGTVCDQLIYPGSALGLGAIAGFLSVAGFVFIQPYLERKIGLHDTCGIHNLHGMPSLLSALAGVVAASQAHFDGGDDNANNNYYGSEYKIWTGRGTSIDEESRDANKQAAYQFAFIIITMVIAVAGGLLTGMIVKLPCFGKRDIEPFTDKPDWEVPEIEYPYFFDKRGEVPRDQAIKAAKEAEEAALLAPNKDDLNVLETRLNLLVRSLVISC